MQNKPEQDRNQEATVYLVSRGFVGLSCPSSSSPLRIHDMPDAKRAEEQR
jgi:hypothetical protein